MSLDEEQSITKEELIRKFRTSEILKATQRLLERHGLVEITMEMIAEQAGISKGTIYLYFKNKEQLLISLIEGVLDRIHHKVDEIVSGDQTPVEKLRKFLQLTKEGISRYGHILRLYFSEAPLSDRVEMQDHIQTLINKYMILVGHIANIVKEGIEAGVFRKIDPKKAAFIFMEMSNSLLKPTMIASFQQLAVDIDFILDIFLNGIKKTSTLQLQEDPDL